MDSTKGYIHVYTGNGKGKTTAAFGLAVRALCAGKSVYIGQFVKSMRYNETKIGQLFDQVKIEQLGRGCFIGKDPEAIDIRMARDGLTRCAALLESGEYDVSHPRRTDHRPAFRTADDRRRTECPEPPSSCGRSRRHGTLCPAGTYRRGRPGDRNAGNQTLLHAGRPFPRRDRPLTGQKRSSSPDYTGANNSKGTLPKKRFFSFRSNISARKLARGGGFCTFAKYNRQNQMRRISEPAVTFRGLSSLKTKSD